MEDGSSVPSLTLCYLRALKELPWLKTDCYSQVLQATSKHLEQALKNWFEGRAKKPRFKAKSNRQSISFPQNVKVLGSQIKVPKVGLIDAIITKEIEGTIKTVTISVTPSGKYFASVGLEEELPEPLTSTDGVVTGIDLGLKDYVTCHNGNGNCSITTGGDREEMILLANVLQLIIHKVLLMTKVKIFRLL
ncbi:MAG: transposase [Xenococcaceae cyanobacterium MO_234.B1]|nr:transposase [Xenococcaceae cyanobacterium MO_234.B1]